MNKKQSFGSDIWVIAWIIWGISSLGLHAITLELDPANILPLTLGLSIKERNFLKTVMDIRILKSNKVHFYKNATIGSGSYGIVYKGRYGKQNIVVKTAQTGKKPFLEKEFNNSRDLLLTAIEAYRTNTIPIILLPRIRFLVCSFGKTMDGRLVQRYIKGQNVYDIIQSGETPYTGGYPDDFREAIRRASNLFRVLSVLHRLGFIFGDIRLGNIVIENNPDQNYPCYFVDFGMQQKIGTYPPDCIFGQPVERLPQEYRAAHQTFYRCQEQVEQANFALQNVQTQLQSCSCASMDNDKELLAQKQQQLKAKQIKLQQKLTELQTQLLRDYPTAQPSFDIHQSVPVLKAIVLGKSESEVLENSTKFQPHVIARLQILFGKMLDPDPDKRPSAEKIALELQDISFSS